MGYKQQQEQGFLGTTSQESLGSTSGCWRFLGAGGQGWVRGQAVVESGPPTTGTW